MNKIKLIFMSIAILGAVVGAFATNKRSFCEQEPQYFRYMYQGEYVYVWAMEYGVDYECLYTPNPIVCTYYWDTETSQMLPCTMGLYQPIY